MTSILDRHRERFRATPGDTQAFEALEEHLFLAGQWDEVIALYEHRLTAPALAANPGERAKVQFRLGQIYEDRLGEPERAIACYGEVLRSDPAHRTALMQLRRLHAAQGRWDVALQIAEVEIELPMRPGERAALLCEIGCLWLDRLGDAEQALVHFERALEDQPDRREGLEGAARALELCRQHAEAAEYWERLASQLKGRARAAAQVSLAKLAEGPLAQPDRARELYRAALGDDPDNPDAIRAVSIEAARRKQWPLLADLLERRYGIAGNDAERANLAVDLGRLHLAQLANPSAAHLWLSRAVELGSDDPDVHEAVADYAREHGDEEALLRSLERVLALRGEAAPVSLRLEAASLYADRGDHERAVAELERAAERAPDDALIAEALSDALARVGRDEELVDVLERRAALAAADPAAQANALGELAALYEQRLGDVEAATAAYERAFEVDASAPGLAAALGRLYRKAEAWGPLRSFLATAGRDGPEAERLGYLVALGNLEREHFGDPVAAARSFEAALLVDPTCPDAHQGLQELAVQTGDEDAVLRAYRRESEVTSDRARLSTLLEEIVTRLDRRGDADEALEWGQRWVQACPESRHALERCADLQERTGHDGIVTTLRQLDAILPSAEVAANRRRLAGACARLGRIGDAVAGYRWALEADPQDVAALEELAAVLEAEGRLEELAQTWRQLVELLPDEPRVDRLDALAALLADRLGDVGGAIDALQRLAREANPPPDVAERLENLLERAARYDELATHLAERAEREPDSDAIQLRRAAVLLDHLGRFDAAVDTYRALRARRPDSSEVAEGLERALRASGDLASLAEFLGEQATRDGDAERRDRCAFERAVLLDDALERSAEAAADYRRLVAAAADPALRAEAAGRLEALLERSGDWPELRRHLEDQLPGVSGPERAALAERLGRMCRDQLGDAAGAIEHFRIAVAESGDRADLWHDLALLYVGAERFDAAVEAFEAEIAAGPDRKRELALRSRAAALCEQQLSDGDRARVHYERILELDPSHAAASEFLIDHCQRVGDPARVAALLESRLAALDGAPREADGPWAAQRTALRVRIAGLRATQLDDPDGAIAILEPALGEIGPAAVVAEPLADLYQRAGYTDDLIALCRAAADACDAESERANWSVRVGDALRGAGRLDEAAAAYRRALTDRPDDRDVQAALRDLYRRLGEGEALTRLLEVDLSHLAGAEEVPTRLELAQLLAGSQNRGAEALIHLRRVLEIEPGHRAALAQALALAEELSVPEITLELLNTALARPEPPSVRARLLSQQARLFAGLPGQRDAAVRAYREALSLDPSRSDDRAALREQLAASGDWDAVLDCLFQEAGAASGEARAAILERAAALAWDRRSPDAALPWLERLRVERPDDPEVALQICEVHRRAGRPDALLHALDDAVAAGAAPRDLRLEQARVLAGDLGSPARAIWVLETARSEAPGDPEVLQRLEQLYRSAERHRERAGVLDALIQLATGESRVALLCDAAALYRGPLGNPQRATEHLLAAVAATRGSGIYPELLRALGEALADAGRPDAWARCAEEELRVLDPNEAVLSDRRRELRRALAETYERELGRPDAALRHLRALVKLKWTGGYGAGNEELDAIEGALLRLLRAEGSWLELEGALAAHLQRRPGSADRWLELARLREERLRTPTAAAAAYRSALEDRPGDLDAIRGLRRCAELLGDWREVARTLEQELAERADLTAPERSALLRRLGDVSWQRLESTTRASRAYASALEASPQDFASLRSLERLLEAMEDWRGAADLYESEVEMLGEREPERRHDASLRAGQIARDHLDEPERALRAYLAAAELGALAAPRRAELAELQLQNGDEAAFAEQFAHWCDDPETSPTPADRLRLASALERLGRDAEALERVEQALAADADDPAAWDAAARLRERRGDAAGAAAALSRAAGRLPDDEAAPRLLRAAGLIESSDAEEAEQLLRSAARRDPADAAVCAALARVCHTLEDFPEALEMAGRALDLDATAGGLDAPLRLETALLGARAARVRGNQETAARFYGRALAVDPEHPDALAEYGETLAGLGDLTGARAAIETRLGLDTADANAALHLAMLGAALEAAGETDAAVERLEAAIAADPSLDRAHEDLVRLHRDADRIDAGVACLERWAERGEPRERAARLLRAAEWELDAGDRPDDVERHLREVLDADPELARAWELLGTLLWEQGRSDDVLDLSALALAGLGAGETRGCLALLRGRVLEQRGERREAADAFGIAAVENPGCVEAALSKARLLRALGEWRPAADTLREFAERHPGGDDARLADVMQQLGRLLAGPLEDVEAAITAYRRAVELDPERVDTRAALAEFLSHRAADCAEALAHHEALLEADPTHAASLRVLMRIARERDNASAIAGGLEILRALGIASPHERDEVATAAPPTFAGDRQLANPLWEKLRQMSHEAAREIAAALESAELTVSPAAPDSASAFRSATLAAEARLTASALLPLTVPELAEVLKLVVALTLEPDQVDGDGRLVNAMSSAIRRRARRRLRRILEDTSLEEVAQVDFGAWRSEVRALAAAVALDETGGDLRTALTVLIAGDSDRSEFELPDDADMTPYVAAYPQPSALLRRVVRSWLASL